MKTILIHSPTLKENSMYERVPWNLSFNFWIHLRDELLGLGYELKTSDNNSLKNCEWVFFFDEVSIYPYKGLRGFISKLIAVIQGKAVKRNLYKECIKAGMQDRMALFLWEPPSVLPENWNRQLFNKFKHIFTWNDNFIQYDNIHKIYWVQNKTIPDIPNIPFNKKKLLVNISMNKHSKHPRELYSERIKAIQYFEQTQPNNFDLFGIGWEKQEIGANKKAKGSEAFSSYKGEVANKWEILPYYKFSLCYENIYDEPGFVTEKIFDCFHSGCIPIYWGANNISEYVDENTFIDRRKFKNYKELEDFLLAIDEEKYTEMQLCIESYLKSERFSAFHPENFFNTLKKILKL